MFWSPMAAAPAWAVGKRRSVSFAQACSMPAALLLLLAVPHIGAAFGVQVHECDPLAPDAARCLVEALSTSGTVAFSPSSALERAHARAARAIIDCEDLAMRRVELTGGILRTSLATSTHEGIPESVKSSGCPMLDEATQALRAAVAASSQQLFLTLQRLVRRDQQPIFRMAHSSNMSRQTGGDVHPVVETLASLSTRGLHLEHFHKYTQQPRSNVSGPPHVTLSPDSEMATLPLHVDAGMLLAMVPGIYARPTPGGDDLELDVALDGTSGMSGLQIMLPDGCLASVPARLGSVVFLVGSGWEEWINPRLSTPLRAAPHTLRLPRLPPRGVRVWYGRMFLPPENALLPPHDVPFGEWWRALSRRTPASSALASDDVSKDVAVARVAGEDATSTAFGDSNSAVLAAQVGCAPMLLRHGAAARKLEVLDEEGCFEDQVWCWMQCMSSSDLHCAGEVVCRDEQSHALWDGERHCSTCSLACAAAPPPPHAKTHNGSAASPPRATGNGFCSGPGTDMHMRGFRLAPSDCIVFFIESWKLDSPLKFYGAVLGTALLAVGYEALTWTRRAKLRVSALRLRKPRLWRLAMAGMFTLQLALGYLLMLVAMTYQLELFLAVIAGLGGGHLLFNVQGPVGESTDACCVVDAEGEALADLAVAGSPARTGAAPQPLPAGLLGWCARLLGGKGLGDARRAALREPLLSQSESDGGEAGQARGGQAIGGGAVGGQRAAAAASSALTLRVEGMTCGRCTASVEKALLALPGVRSAKVDLELGQAAVWGDVAAADAVAAVEATGRDARVLSAPTAPSALLSAGATAGKEDPPDTTLHVEGMSCSKCTDSVRRALLALPGVDRAQVDLDSKEARVWGNASADALIEACESTGKLATLVPAQGAAVEGARIAEGKSRAKYLAQQQDSDLSCTWLKVPDMECNGCAEKIERVLQGVEGVAEAEVLLDSHLAYISHAEGTSSEAELISAVRALGYSPRVASEEEVEAASASSRRSLNEGEAPPASQMVVLQINGMSCAACAAKVEGSLRALRGVNKASISLLAHSGRVEYEPRRVDVPAMVEAIHNIGYDAHPRGGTADSNMLAPEVQSDESLEWRDRFVGSLFITVPMMLFSMVLPHTPLGAALAQPLFPGISWRVAALWLLATPMQVIFGGRFYLSAFAALRHCVTNMDTLVALGTSVAYGFSVLTVVVNIFSKERDRDDQQCFEMAAMLITFILLGKFLEASAKRKTTEAVSRLLSLQPQKALLCSCITELDREPREVPAATLVKGDVFKVLPGRQVVVDGVVLRGRSEVDESMLSGEPLPVLKQEKDNVTGGTINGNGVLWVLATAKTTDGTLAHIMQVVSDAQHRKPQVQALADRIARYFVPTALLVSLLTFFGWSARAAFGGVPQSYLDASHVASPYLLAVYFGCATLVVACPCALGLATPTAVMVSCGVSAQRGILLKGGDVLEKSAKVSAVLFDKTGTLTTGRPGVQLTKSWRPSLKSSELLRLAACAERASDHPIAGAIVSAAGADALTVEPLNFTQTPGGGIDCCVEGARLLLGNRAWMSEHGLRPSAAQEAEVAAHEAKGSTVVLAAMQKQCKDARAGAHGMDARDGSGGALVLSGIIVLADELKPDAAEVVAYLRRRGTVVWMVSGDNQTTANFVAKQAGVDPGCVAAGITPVGKLDVVKRLKAEGHVVAFVGDGINDAPALAAADVGMAMGSGMDVAIETADVVLMRPLLQDVVTCFDIARVAMNRIRINFVWAFGYNAIGVPLAAGVFYPEFDLPPMFAGAAMALSSVSVVCSSLLIRTYKPPSIGHGSRNQTTC